ncbi:MAG: putative bifunctional diguanylate cyclase/phosphodiesterase, partial [Acidimicrobiia bacterium]
DIDAIEAGGWRNLLWLLATLLTALVTFACNSLFTCLVLALHQRLPVWPMLRKSVGATLMMDGLLLALAPVFAVVAMRSLLLVPLLLATVWIIYQSGQLALRNQHEANHDLLTGVPNRRLFDEHAAISIEAARRRGERLALVQVDLNGFKAINDRLGHHYGDLVLRVVAERLLAAKRPTDLVARLGGDEFAILVRDVGDVATAEATAARFHAAVTPSMTIEGLPLSVGGSFGVAVFPDHGEDLTALLHNADMAMYRAKSQGLGVAGFAPEQPEPRPARSTLLAELGRALSDDELFLHYQPRVDLFTGRVVGVEALVRWNHPRLGVVQPAAFMAQAEQSDLIGALTERVVRLAVAQAAAWRRSGIELTVSVNASARNLMDFRFPELVAAVLAEHGVEPSMLELEITENSMLVDPERTATILAMLRSVGVTISVDDFGTGYSSLASLRDLTIDHVKIDRSFVSGMPERPGDLMIVRSIIELAHNLGLGTVAEGAERVEELEVLRSMGCDAVQGYLLAPPSSPEELERRLRVGYDLDALRPALDALDALAALHEPAAGVQELSSLHGKGSAA